MQKTLRASDNKTESAVSSFLDKHFYPNNVLGFRRYSDYNSQMKGVDVSFSYNNLNNILVDEKCAGHYINKNIPTFAFEIDFFTNGNQLVDGWFFDENKLTQFYLLNWITAKKDKDITTEDIISLDCILISRFRMHKYLESVGINKNFLKSKSNEIRKVGTNGIYEKQFNIPYYYYLTTFLAERPLNIIIRKEKLIELSDLKFTVKSNPV